MRMRTLILALAITTTLPGCPESTTRVGPVDWTPLVCDQAENVVTEVTQRDGTVITTTTAQEVAVLPVNAEDVLIRDWQAFTGPCDGVALDCEVLEDDRLSDGLFIYYTASRTDVTGLPGNMTRVLCSSTVTVSTLTPGEPGEPDVFTPGEPRTTNLITDGEWRTTTASPL